MSLAGAAAQRPASATPWALPAPSAAGWCAVLAAVTARRFCSSSLPSRQASPPPPLVGAPAAEGELRACSPSADKGPLLWWPAAGPHCLEGQAPPAARLSAPATSSRLLARGRSSAPGLSSGGCSFHCVLSCSHLQGDSGPAIPALLCPGPARQEARLVPCRANAGRLWGAAGLRASLSRQRTGGMRERLQAQSPMPLAACACRSMQS
jgi:hypothetical protein